MRNRPEAFSHVDSNQFLASAQLLAPPFRTLTATAAPAADWPYVLIPIFLAVIVAELLARLYAAFGDDKHTLLLLVFLWLAIRRAGMVDVARNIFPALAIYGHMLFKLEKVFTAAAIRFFFGYNFPPIFGDHCGLLYRAGSKQP
jgi:hypothetical protein